LLSRADRIVWLKSMAMAGSPATDNKSGVRGRFLAAA
jgi:hypothetical protein